MRHDKKHDIQPHNIEEEADGNPAQLSDDEAAAQAEAVRIEAESVEAALAEERKQERSELQAQHRERMQTLRKLTQVVKSVTELSQPRGQGTETLHSELKTLRAAVLLAHSITAHDANVHDANSHRINRVESVESQVDDRPFQVQALKTVPRPNAVQAPPPEPFTLDPIAIDGIAVDATGSDPFLSSFEARGKQASKPVLEEVLEGLAVPQAKRKRTMSAEARARISAAQTLIWARRRGEKGETP